MIIRAYQLQKNDVYIKCGTIYVVRHITHGKIFYNYLTSTTWWSRDYIGAFSKERVELIDPADVIKYCKNKKTKARVAAKGLNMPLLPAGR